MNLDLSKYKQIIFDFEGTISTIAVDWSAYKEALHDAVKEKFALDIDFSHFSKGLNEVNNVLGEEGNKLCNQVCEDFEKTGKIEAKAIPQCIELINSFNGEKYIWSSNQSIIIKEMLENLGILDRFKDIIGKDHVGLCKPHTDGFQLLHKRYELRVDETLFVGNSTSDREAARSLGMDYLDVSEIN